MTVQRRRPSTSLMAALREAQPPPFHADTIAHLELGATRRRGVIRVRALPGDPGRVLVVCDDMPFLVDTLLMTLEGAGHPVERVSHPVFAAGRDARGNLRSLREARDADDPRESWQQAQLRSPLREDEAPRVTAALMAALRDVAAAVRDFRAMRRRVEEVLQELESHPPPLPADEIEESRAFLRWLLDDHFTFLGSRRTRIRRRGRRLELEPEAGSELGVLRPSVRGVALEQLSRREPRVRPEDLLREARTRQLVIITKSTARATVHRNDHLDYVGIKRHDVRGRVHGEHRFVGLWTSATWREPTDSVPLLRRKMAQIKPRLGLPPSSYDGRRLAHILESLPRDELLQAPAADLQRYARRILGLQEERGILVLLRRERFHRFYSVLVFVPRDRYDEELSGRIAALLSRTLQGTATLEDLALHEQGAVRLHLLVQVDPHARDLDVDVERLERDIAAAAAGWTDLLRDALADLPTGLRASLLELAASAPPDFRAAVPPARAVEDLRAVLHVAQYGEPRRRLEQDPGDCAGRVHLRQALAGEAAALSTLLPVLERFGLRVLGERRYTFALPSGDVVLQDLWLERPKLTARLLAARAPAFLEALHAVRTGVAEDDGFNALVLAAGLDIRELRVLRAACRHLLQTGLPFGQAIVERTLASHPCLAQQLFELFEARFDPGLAPRAAARRATQLQARLRRQLESIASLDEDRVLRSLLDWMLALVRTSYYQHDGRGQGLAPALAFKLDPAKLPDLPRPVPRHEIFVHGTSIEGVHLRMADVARGGIRWSDRAHDFRTEILGLMKAQHVKNALIVPAGAKGGFVTRLPLPSDPGARQAAGIDSYRRYIGALLDITDNLVRGRVQPPPRVRRHDGDDTYLVVAADKGTASFSDIANGIALERGFWLGDAFASGGSAGYDHKAMGITARGAWECVRRHFHEMGVDLDRAVITVAGIGDMSGDVFGNGMLLSRRLKLLAAFDHRHVFLDPDPDPEASWQERARLFRLPRSSWADYDPRLISAGGGVHPRNAKAIAVTPQVRRVLAPHLDGVTRATPNQFISAILRMSVDLLWNGGIGTYVKSSTESHVDAGDRANDAVRVNGAELRARVVGEGGNLGFTQRGRIEYALSGGRIDMDSIDNSAGVNTSDLEVNFKILLAGVPASRRNRVLKAAAGEVASLVLRNNVLQSRALSLMLRDAAAHPDDYLALARSLARSEGMDPALERLPDEETLADRRERGLSWTRPELAVLLSWQKIAIQRSLLASDVPADPWFAVDLQRYFPERLRRARPTAVQRHALRAQLIATAIGNSLVNRMGAAFPLRVASATRADVPQLVRAYAIVREVLGLRELWEAIEAPRTGLAAETQLRAMAATVEAAERLCGWWLPHRREPGVEAAVRAFGMGMRQLAHEAPRWMQGAARQRCEQLATRFEQEGLAPTAARRLAALGGLEAGFDIIELARGHHAPVTRVAAAHAALGERLGIDFLREAIAALPATTTWQATARGELHRVTLELQRRFTARALASGAAGDAAAALPPAGMATWDALLAQLRASPQRDLAALSVAVEALRQL